MKKQQDILQSSAYHIGNTDHIIATLSKKWQLQIQVHLLNSLIRFTSLRVSIKQTKIMMCLEHICYMNPHTEHPVMNAICDRYYKTAATHMSISGSKTHVHKLAINDKNETAFMGFFMLATEPWSSHWSRDTVFLETTICCKINIGKEVIIIHEKLYRSILGHSPHGKSFI